MTPTEDTKGDEERCPICGTDDPEDTFSMLDRGRSFDAGISGCPDPFHHTPTPDEPRPEPINFNYPDPMPPTEQGEDEPERWLDTNEGITLIQDGTHLRPATEPEKRLRQRIEQAEADHEAANHLAASTSAAWKAAEHRVAEVEKVAELARSWFHNFHQRPAHEGIDVTGAQTVQDRLDAALSNTDPTASTGENND